MPFTRNVPPRRLPVDSLEHAHRTVRVQSFTFVVAVLCAFGAGYICALYSIGWIVTTP